MRETTSSAMPLLEHLGHAPGERLGLPVVDLGVFSGTYTWSPLEPDVLARLSQAQLLEQAVQDEPTSQHSTIPAGAPGSRSNTIIVGRSGAGASDSDVCSSMSARLASQISVGRSCASV